MYTDYTLEVPHLLFANKMDVLHPLLICLPINDTFAQNIPRNLEKETPSEAFEGENICDPAQSEDDDFAAQYALDSDAKQIKDDKPEADSYF